MHSAPATALERCDFINAPVSQVLPFPVEQPFIERIGEQPMSNYTEWMNSCSLITLSDHPAISVPCGFSDDGFPVGLQIIGRYRDELTLLKFAQTFESISKAYTTRTIV